jgi:4-hydroxy-tetrahydrodipicolinate synthase
MMSSMISGAFTALVTPFNATGEVDFPGLARLLAWHEASGMDGVVVAGTNGEGPSLSSVEKRDTLRFAVEHAGKLKVILGAGTCSITEAIWLSQQAQKAGAIASLMLPPFYFNATDRGLLAWFTQLLSNCDLPCVVYNFPKTTGITISPALLESLFAFDHCVGIKDSSGDLAQLNAYLSVASGHNRSVLVGDERLLLHSLSSGGSGTISGLANTFPVLVSRQVRERSDVLQSVMNQAVENVKKHPQPAVHKAILSHRGLPAGQVRAPLEPISEDARTEVLAFVDSFGF